MRPAPAVSTSPVRTSTAVEKWVPSAPGAQSAGMLPYVAYPYFSCRVQPANRFQAFAKLTGSQRPIGSFYPESRLRMVFLGVLELGDETIACKRAQVFADWPALGKQTLIADLAYGRRDGSLDVAVDGLRLGEGRLAVRGVLRDGSWSARAELVIHPRSKAYFATVTRLTPREVRERVELRALLEVRAGEEASRRMGDEEFAELEMRLAKAVVQSGRSDVEVERLDDEKMIRHHFLFRRY